MIYIYAHNIYNTHFYYKERICSFMIKTNKTRNALAAMPGELQFSARAYAPGK